MNYLQKGLREYVINKEGIMINYIFVFFTIFNSTLLWAKSIYEAPCGKYIFRVEITFKKIIKNV